MIRPTSLPYEIATYYARVRSLHSDGTPKTKEFTPLTTLLNFPQAVQDRVRAMAESRRFRSFVFGMPFSFHKIEEAWLYVCFDEPVDYQVLAKLREMSGLKMEQWGFFTFDEHRLEGYRDGGIPPEVNLICFSGIDEANQGMNALGVPELIRDEELRADASYFMFAEYELGGN